MKYSRTLSTLLYIFAIVILLLSLSSCTNNNTADLRSYVENERQIPKKSIPAFPSPHIYAVYNYNSNDLRDPFARNERGITTPPTACIRSTRQKEALQLFPLDSLNLVGSVEQKGERWALIQDQDRKIYRLKKGDHIGLNEGKILTVTESEILLLERVSDRIMGCVKRKSTLTIKI